MHIVFAEHFGALIMCLPPSGPPNLANSGALAQAFTADRLGRRGSILFWSAVFTAGVAIQTGTTYSLVQLVIGRYIAGLGVGSLSGTDLFHHVVLLTDRVFHSHRSTLQRRDYTESDSWNDSSYLSSTNHQWVCIAIFHLYPVLMMISVGFS